MPQRILAALLFALILFGGLTPTLLRLPFRERGSLAAAFEALPDRFAPEYPHFLREVARRTSRGEAVAVMVPWRHWNDGYAYGYYRASYFLSGRRVIPLVDPDDTVHLQRVAEADWILSWQMPLPPDRFEVAWEGHGGLLARVRR
jgi:hypothetical protein